MIMIHTEIPQGCEITVIPDLNMRSALIESEVLVDQILQFERRRSFRIYLELV